MLPLPNSLEASRHPNLLGVNSFRYNGLINRRAVGVVAAADGKGIELQIKKQKFTNKPAQSIHTIPLKRNSRRSLNTIKKTMKNGHYRPRLTKLAMRRASAILRSQKDKKPSKKRTHNKPKADWLPSYHLLILVVSLHVHHSIPFYSFIVFVVLAPLFLLWGFEKEES